MSIGGSLSSGGDFYNLVHVKITSPVNGQVLVYDSASSNWVNANGGGGAASLAGLTDVTLTAPAANDFLVKSAGNWVNLNPASARTALGLGSIATQSSSAVSITGGSISGVSIDFTGDTWNGNTIDIAHGGTGQTTKSAAYDGLSPNTTKGDITAYTGATNARLAVGSNNLVLMADSTQTTGLKWGSALLPANNLSDVSNVTTAFNTVSPLTTKGDLIVHNGTNNIRVAVGTDGQALIANSAQPSGVAWQTLPFFSWTTVAVNTALVANTGYISTNAALNIFTLPATAAVGDTFKIIGRGAGGWKVAQNAGQTIDFNGVATTTGAGGSLQSTGSNNTLELVCVVANTDFEVFATNAELSLI